MGNLNNYLMEYMLTGAFAIASPRPGALLSVVKQRREIQLSSVLRDCF